MRADPNESSRGKRLTYTLAGNHWHEPEESGFFQPIVTAVKAGDG
jgi:hypothetical protein